MSVLIKYFFVFIIITSGCSSQFKFEEKYTNHFPKESENKVLYYENSMKIPKDFKQLGASKKEGYKYEGKVKLIVDSLIDKSVNYVNYDDTCNIILPIRYYRNIDIGKPVVSECHGSSVVISSFVEAKQFLSLDLSKFTFFILEVEQGKFLKEEDLFDEGVMPSPWTHGYTKGFALNKNDKMVIFWIDIW